MSPFGCSGLLVAVLALLCCPGSGEETFEVRMWPERLVVEPRGSWEVNCSTSCTQPEMGGLETTLTKTLLDSQPQWKRYLISNVSEDTDLQCYFLCAGKHQSKHLSIIVYQPPEQVVLKLQPTWVAVGNSFTIECRVPAVEPLESLTLILLHGNKTLHNQTFEGRAAVPQEATATLSSTAHLEDRKHNFSCLAQLDLRSRGGGVFHWVSEPQMLEIYEPMPDNQMVIIITVVSVLLFLFVTSVLLCFVFGQHWRQRRTGTYGVRAAWRRLPRAFRAQPA
ncbi:intercellular adhesion molecule 2 isoform X1 [Oryctolagus cuniculus]|nr:intercellular adhesion molecule 2 isoform X1 [Oryctolagus cuniculus]XP_051681791.1 intercellular adhesion molecule 2 isoform X1 [Oryctolagus cuniculus]XP_051681792.1 intercellular adhesion molecule 2 isoform X1 [Oryctolagus cuniculus]